MNKHVSYLFRNPDTTLLFSYFPLSAVCILQSTIKEILQVCIPDDDDGTSLLPGLGLTGGLKTVPLPIPNRYPGGGA